VLERLMTWGSSLSPSLAAGCAHSAGCSGGVSGLSCAGSAWAAGACCFRMLRCRTSSRKRTSWT